MNNKESYRQYFIAVRRFVNFPAIYKEVGIQQPNFSRFLHGTDNAISIDKLVFIKSRCDELLVDMKEAEIVFRSEK